MLKLRHTPWQDMLGTSFPKAPASMEDLFSWPVYNAKQILSIPELRNNFIKFVMSGGTLVLDESYAGVGTCGSALVQQFNAMKAEIATELPVGI